MSKNKLFLFVIVAWFLAYGVFQGFHPYDSITHTSYILGFLIIPTMLALISAILCTPRMEPRYLFIFTTGIFLTSVSDLLLLSNRTSSPKMNSIILWMSLAGALLLILLWILQPVVRRHDFIRVKLLLDMAISTGAITVLAWLLFIQPNSLINVIPELDAFTYTLILIDISLFAILLNLALIALQPAIQRRMLVYVVGVFFLALGDISVLLAPALHEVQPGTSLDIGYLLGYSFISVSVLIGTDDKFTKQKSQPIPEQTFGERVQSVLAVALSLVLLGYLFVFWRMEQDIPQTIMVFSAMVWLLLIARQGVAAGEFELQQYSLLFNQSAEPSFLCTSDHKLLLVNNAMTAICQADHEEKLLGSKLGHFFPDLNMNLLGSDKPVELILKTAQNKYLPVDLAIKSVQLGWFRRKVIAGVIHDLTWQKQQQAELQDALDKIGQVKSELEILNNELELRVAEKTSSLSSAYKQLEEQNRMLQDLDRLKSDFVSMVSHELRAPLTNISGGIELLLSRQKMLAPENRTSLQLVQAEINRLTRIVESILDLSALDAGRMPIYPEPIHWNNIPQIVADSTRSISDSKLIFAFPKMDVVFLADPLVLGSVFSYLIDNSRKYAPDSNIEISGNIAEGHAILQLCDHGPGIPQEMLARIFDKFVRADNSDSREVYGRGLGLYMAKRLIEAMHGTISADNQDTGGARLTIVLPLMES